jgi:hypothetical protein
MPTFCPVGNPTGRPTIHVTNCGFVASMFSHWRGTIVYRFAIAKTVYHSGRLRITWIPGTSKAAPTGDEIAMANDFPTSYTQIYDLKDTTEIIFKVPYVHRQPVLPIKFWAPENPYVEDWTDGVNGYISLSVDNPLRASSTVSGTVDITCWQAGGEDMQFFYPNTDQYVPYAPNTITNSHVPESPPEPAGNLLALDDKNTLMYTPHTGVYANEDDHELTHENGAANADSFISKDSDAQHSTTTGEQVFGELILNLSQLKRKFSKIADIKLKSGGDTLGEQVMVDTT